MFNLPQYFSPCCFFNKVSGAAKGLFYRPSLFSSFDYLMKKVNLIPYLMLVLLQKVNANESICGTYTNSRGKASNNDYCLNYDNEDLASTIKDLLLSCNSTLQATTQTFTKMLSFYCFDHNEINMTFNQLDHRFLNCLCWGYDCFCPPPEDNNNTDDNAYNTKIMLYVLGITAALMSCRIGYRLYHCQKAREESKHDNEHKTPFIPHN